MRNKQAIQRWTIPLALTIRLATREDLPALEWFGLHADHREIISRAYERQERGEVLMLVADVNGFPVGQAWVDLARMRDERAGLLWAVRVIPFLRRMGIGSHLIAAAEETLRERGYEYAVLGVEKGNPDARRLYERLGYRPIRERREEYFYTAPDGTVVRVPLDEWILRKRLEGV